MKDFSAEQHRLMTVSLVIVAAVALMATVVHLKSVLVPFVLAIFVSYLIAPLVDVLQTRWKLPRGLALVIAILIILGGGAFVVFMLSLSFSEVVNKAGIYKAHLVTIWEDVTVFLRDDLGFAAGADGGVESSVLNKLKSLPIETMALDSLGTAATLMSDAVLVLLFTIYILVGRSPRTQSDGFWGDIDQSVKRYIVVKVYTSTANAVIFGAILLGFGVDLAVVFGVLCFLLNFIPNVGSLIAIILPLPVAIVGLNSSLEVAILMGLLILNQNIIGNVIEPKLMGKGLDLHPVTVLLGLALWGSLWGPVGMVLSAPLMAVLRIVFDRNATTRPMAELLAGRIGSMSAEADLSEAPE